MQKKDKFKKMFIKLYDLKTAVGGNITHVLIVFPT